MYQIAYIIGFLLFGLNLSGQSVWIDSLYINPSSPTIEDTIEVVGEIRTSSAGCELISRELEIDETNKIIQITACYGIGPLDTICPSIDTFIIGQLEAGEYEIKLIAQGFETIVNPNGDCSSSTNETVIEGEIIVNGTNSIQSNVEQINKIKLLENPVERFAVFQIKETGVNRELVMIDNVGRIVGRYNVKNNQVEEFQIDITLLPSGIYYCYLIEEKTKSKVIKMIKK